jgi:hypothetical protein
MSYFNNFPNTIIDLSLSNEDPKTFVVRDINTNVRFRKDLLSNILAYELYDIQDGDTPEKLSEIFYGSPYYQWVIMLVNERYDYLNDFPMSQRELEAMIERKYGERQFQIGQYETVEIKNSSGRVLLKPGIVVDSTFTFSFTDNGVSRTIPNSECTVAISNYDLEFRRNESLRQIKVLTPELLDEIVVRFRDALGVS